MNLECIAYVQQKKWNYRKPDAAGNITIKDCPYCQDDKHHFSINLSKDGNPFQCFKCDHKGNLTVLQRDLGDLPTLVSGTRTAPSAAEVLAEASRAVSGFNVKPVEEVKKVFPADWINEPHRRLLNNEGNGLTALNERGIDEATIRKFKIGVVNEANGNTLYGPNWAFPYLLDHAGTIGLVKYRTIPPDKKFMSREAGMASVLYNQAGIDFDAQALIVCEGEIDCLSVYQCGHRNVVSVPTGAKAIKSDWIALFEKFEKIVLVYDHDTAGMAGRAELQKRIGQDRVALVDLPGGMDANDVLKNLGESALFEAIEKANPTNIEGVVQVGEAMEELQESLLMGEEVDGGYDWMFPSLNNSIGKVVPGTLTLVTGKRGTGKTTLIQQQFLQWAKEGIPCLLWCGEMTPRQLVIKLVQCVVGVERSDINEHVIAQAYEEIASLPLFIGYHAIKPNKELILDMATQAYKRYGVKMICVDNLLCITQGEKDPMLEEGRVAQAFNNWSIYYDANIMLVAHPRKTGGNESSNHVETADDIKGNSNVINLASQAFSVFRENNAPKNAKDLWGNIGELLDRKTSIIPLKGRYSGGDRIGWIYNEGEYSRFRECTELDFTGGGQISGTYSNSAT